MSAATMRLNGGLLLTARTFTVHCGKCGRAWSIPAEQPTFDEQRVQVIAWYTAHDCTPPELLLEIEDAPSNVSRVPAEKEL